MDSVEAHVVHEEGEVLRVAVVQAGFGELQMPSPGVTDVKGPQVEGAGNPKSEAKNAAETCLSRAVTMAWLI